MGAAGPGRSAQYAKLVLLGWLVSRLGLSWLPAWEVGILRLEVAQLATWGMMLVGAGLLMWAGRERLFFVSLGWQADVATYLALRPGTQEAVSVEPWDGPALVGSALALALALALVLVLGRGPGRTRHGSPASWLPMGVIVFGCIVAYRISQEMLWHLPNEERSLFIAGCEIHHISQGVALLAAGGVWIASGRWAGLARWLGPPILGGAAGMVVDQASYYLLRVVSDEAYRSPASLWGAVLAGVLLMAMWYAIIKNAYATPARDPIRPDGLPPGARWVVGHRGAAKLTCENTLEAITLAAETGCRMVEVDVARTRDGALVLMHDASVDRTTDGSGKVADLTLEQVQALRTPAGHVVPTLDAALALTNSLGLVAFLDMKRTRGARDELLRLLDQHDLRRRVILDWETFAEARAFKAAAPEVSVVISPFVPVLLAESVVHAGVDGLDAFHLFLSARLVRRLIQAGCVVTCWFTVRPQVARKVLARGVDGLMTDDPQALKRAGIPMVPEGR